MRNRVAPSSRQPPLPDDIIPDILLRLPPDDPAGLVRASAVSKAWRSIITDPAFHGSYRALHPTAPVLGFLHRPKNPELPRFVSTTSFGPAAGPAADHRQHPLDCRHGRAVFYDYSDRVFNGVRGGYVVWDPATGELHKLPRGPGGERLPRPAVVCAAGGGCDHRGCSGGPFIVAFVGLQYQSEFDFGYNDDDDEDETIDDEDETIDDDDEDETIDDDDEDETIDDYGGFDDYGGSVDASACFYASDTGELDVGIDVHLGEGPYYLDDSPAALVGDSLYFLCTPRGILRYRYGLLRRLGGISGMFSAGIRERDVLSMMELPKGEHLGIGKRTTNVVVMAAEGGGLGLACLGMSRTKLYLLARDTEGAIGDDATAWVQRRVIDLKTLLPVGNPKREPCLKGIAQDANVIFVSTEDGVFSIDLGRSLLQARKVCEEGVLHDYWKWMYPFVSFYTESLLLKLASSILPAPGRNQ